MWCIVLLCTAVGFVVNVVHIASLHNDCFLVCVFRCVRFMFTLNSFCIFGTLGEEVWNRVTEKYNPYSLCFRSCNFYVDELSNLLQNKS